MNLYPHAFKSVVIPDEQSPARMAMLREDVPRLIVIAVSGTFAISGTSSAEPTRLWEDSYLRESEWTASSSGRSVLSESDIDVGEASGETTGRAISELRRISGLTWEQLGQLFGVSRRSVHYWASGQPLNTANQTRLMRVLDVVRVADRGDARSTRAALLNAADGVAPFDLLVSEDFDGARALLGIGAGHRGIPATELSAAAKARRQPPPPEALVGALQDRIHHDVDRRRAARTVRNKRRGPR